MDLDRILEQLVTEVHGGLGAIFIDREGEAISHYTTLTAEKVKLMGAHYGIAWLQAEALTERFLNASSPELIFRVEKGICLMKPIERDYLVFLILDRSGSVGQGRRWLAWALEEIRKEI